MQAMLAFVTLACAISVSAAPSQPRFATPLTSSTLVTRQNIDLGSCSDISVTFGAGLDGRKPDEFSFIPNNLQDFAHGSAKNPDIIYQCQCDTLVNKCGLTRADASVSLCEDARNQANALGATGASADKFNSLLGANTNFAALDASNAGNADNANSIVGRAAGNNNGANDTSTDAGLSDGGKALSDQASSLSADDLQKSFVLAANLVQPASASTGQEENADPGQVESATSINNFINHCATRPDLPLTNGEQIITGSCNGIPMGEIMAKDKMPSARVLFPVESSVVEEGQDITFQVKVSNIQTGAFTNAQLTYYSAPAQLNGAGLLIGHQHIAVNAEPSLDSTDPLDPQDFVFFKGMNEPAVNGLLTATAVGGLKAGVYRACTLGSSANHTPIIPPVAQRAANDDCRRFTVVPAGQGNNGNNGNGNGGKNGNANGGKNNGGNGQN